jgi:DNA repair protein RecO (recombination protein O)
MPNQPRSLSVEAVVLRHSDWGEADRLLTLYAPHAGKLRAVAKGARKLHSRKAGHLEPFTRVKLLLARGREFWIVTQAETVDAYLPLRENLVLTGYAAYLVELLDRFTYEEAETPGLYTLLVEGLERLATLADPFIAVRYYEIRLLDVVGFRPQLFSCVICGAQIQAEDQYFDALTGGVVCPRCAHNHPAARPVSKDALRFLRHLQRSNFAEAQRADPPPAVRAEMEALLNFYLTFLLERRLNSPHFITEMRAAGEYSKKQDG